MGGGEGHSTWLAGACTDSTAVHSRYKMRLEILAIIKGVPPHYIKTTSEGKRSALAKLAYSLKPGDSQLRVTVKQKSF